MGDGGLHKGQEERVRLVGPALEFGMELAAQHEGMIVQLGNLHQPPIGRDAGKGHAVALHVGAECVVELKTVAVALLHQLAKAQGRIGPRRVRAGGQLAVIDTQPHRAAHIGDVTLVGHQVDHGKLRAEVELCAVRLVALQNVARKVDAHDLHPQTQAQVGDALLARKVGGADLAFDAAIAKAARHDDARHRMQPVQIPPLFQFLRTDPGDVDVPAHRQARMDQCLFDAQISIFQFHILAHQADA